MTVEIFMDLIRWSHVSAGFVGLAAFWVPILTRKGGRHHRFYGKIFKYCAYVVLSAALLAVFLHVVQGLGRGEGPRQTPGLFAFLVFLGYLALVTFVGLRHGFQVLANKADLTSLNVRSNQAMAWLSIFGSIGLVAYTLYFQPPNQVVLFALSPVGLLTGTGILKAIQGRRTERKAWFYEHMGAMIGTGIAFHTAFAVFGAARLFDLGFSGWISVVPWILPALIGIPATVIWTRYYQRKFGDVPA